MKCADRPVKKCEAAAMDAGYFNNWELSAWKDVTPCDEPAEVDVCGYDLCHGCHEALVLIGHLASVRTPQARRDTWWILLWWKIARIGFWILKTIAFVLLLVLLSKLA